MATWVGYPRFYSAGRSRPVQYIVIHTTEGAEGPDSAEAGHAYDLTRTESVSTHLFVDSNSAVREVPDSDRAYHARYHGNEIGIGVELCGTARQTAVQWRDGASVAELALAAREVAALCQVHGIPPRRLSVAEVRAAFYAAPAQRPKGICGHVDVTEAYPEDGGSHYDPGPNFPWSQFLAMVGANLEDDMTPEQSTALTDVLNILTGLANGVAEVPVHDRDGKLSLAPLYRRVAAEVALVNDLSDDELEAVKTAAREGATAGQDALVAAVVASLPPGASLTRGDVEEALRTVLKTGIGG